LESERESVRRFESLTSAVDALHARFGDRLSVSQTVREQHAGLESHYPGALPDAVLTPQTTAEVADAISMCAAHRLPVIAHGAGTSLEGHLSAEQGGLSLDLSRMNRVILIEPENLLCRVEAGVTREQLNGDLRDVGLFFPVDPGANASLGGMAATAASGTNAVRYGTMRDNVRSLKVVLADGRVIETGTKAAKSAAGYDLTGLMVGSEGTLGVITELTLSLFGIPEVVLAGVCSFDTLAGAVTAVIQSIQAGLPVARIELLDERQIAASNAFSHAALPVQPTLFLEFHGSGASVAEQVESFCALALENGGREMTMACKPEERSRLWKARHQAYFAAKALRPGARMWTTDVCVPIAALAETILATRADIDAEGAEATIVGHVGDGNFHVLFVLDPSRPAEEAQAAAINERMVSRALAAGGTCTGEHGIGLGKRESLVLERGADAVGLMKAVKQLFDPDAILNPGKVFR
jgi:D-lactate dehydrogenase (cytochrome)